MFTRRTATVMTSAPDASCAFTMTAGDEYLPVPTKSRDLKVRPAMVKVSMGSSAADEIDDLDLIAIVDGGRVVGGALDDDQVVLDRDAPRIDLELSQQFTDRQ